MPTQSSILAWEIPWAEKPSSLYSPWGHEESDTTERLKTNYVGVAEVLVNCCGNPGGGNNLSVVTT